MARHKKIERRREIERRRRRRRKRLKLRARGLLQAQTESTAQQTEPVITDTEASTQEAEA
ncbi:hypothetical protein [Thermodesulforhabdus norvegica]|uniref:Uncharacterized protein n=1 Tax=Thermodesulforhabdus norvegica TaxID=39841 RepID=A0A1I4QMJ3_9BACT|nr:hypothetical protein [Thermodesulforhabdus norvegica]SFM40976.1 hypothetical protein SAMN05660836_00104 [Thermodesulforhabdus norvegica]